jgi:hypothetical protein
LDHDVIGEKVFFDGSEELVLIHERWLEHLRMGGSHGVGRGTQSEKSWACTRNEGCKRRKTMAVKEK